MVARSGVTALKLDRDVEGSRRAPKAAVLPQALSSFARRFAEDSGIIQVMEDLGKGLAAGGEVLLLGGGNPAHIPELQAIFRKSLQGLLDEPSRFARLIGDYGPPQGDANFIAALARLLHDEYGWPITPDNIVLSNGSQGGFFLLFNLLAGEFANGEKRRVLLPGTPEYIGYGDAGLGDNWLYAFPSCIRKLGYHEFKYHIDFDALKVASDTGAICVSRPTNPTGNVLTDQEIYRLYELACAHGVPLIIDNAYGVPFPHILYTSVTPIWDEHIIYCMSLSKLGLPGARTGIIIAARHIIHSLTRMNTNLHLAHGNFGPMLVQSLLPEGEILRLSRECIGPYYESRARQAVAAVHEAFSGLDYYLHRPEGAFFLWLWLPDLPISSEMLYQRLKARGVLAVSGHHFFPGLTEEWPHRQECLRLSYAVDPEILQRAVQIIADELRGL